MTDHACPECRARAAAPPDPDGQRTRARVLPGSLDEVLREGLRAVYGRLKAQGIVQRRWVERIRERRLANGRAPGWADGTPSKIVLAGSAIGVTVDRLDDLQQAGVAEPDEVLAAGLGEPSVLELAPAVLILMEAASVALLDMTDSEGPIALRQLYAMRHGLERAAARALRLANSRAELAAISVPAPRGARRARR